MVEIYVKIVDKGVPKSKVLVENLKASKISGENAEKIVEALEKLLAGGTELIIPAGINFLAGSRAELESIFDIFDQENLDDFVDYYRIWLDEFCEGESYEIYCHPGAEVVVKKLPPEAP